MKFALLLAATLLPGFAFAADPTSATSVGDANGARTAAEIALIGGVFTAFMSGFIAWITARNTTRLEHVKRQTELALQISQIVSAKDEETRKAATRRFAVAIIKVVKPADHDEAGMVYFVPMNSRVTIGRDDDNDIVLNDDEEWLSRWHCGFIADQRNVWIYDYASHNGTKVQSRKVHESQLLKDGDKIQIGPYELIFHLIRENRILSQ